MKKILIIDDNKMLAKLLAKKITSSFGFEVDLAFNFAETLNLIEEEAYFLTFADLCLPDAPNGEVVDQILAKNLPVVVLTASNDQATRELFLHKDILSYIYKESESCVDQMISTIKLLDEHNKEKVILALSKLDERNNLKKILNLRLFEVLACAHGEEALNYLNDNADTRLIICDAKMPVIDSLELLTQVREKYPKSELGVIVLGEKDDDLEAKLLNAEANEFITKPFNKELFSARLDKCLRAMSDFRLMTVFKDLEPLTGAKTSLALRNEFEDYVRELNETNEEFAFAFLELDNLKNINEEYGYHIGNLMLKTAVKELFNETMGRDIIGHFSSERICIVLKNTSSERAIKLLSLIRVNIRNKGVLVSLDEVFFTVSIGLSFGKAGSSFTELATKASEALSLAKANGRDRIEVCF